MNRLAKLILGYVAISLVLIGLGFGWLYINSFQDLTLVAPAARTRYITLYYATEDGTGKAGRVENVVINQPMRLKKGRYVAEYVQSGYKKVTRQIDLSDQPSQVSFTYDRTEAELQAILEANRSRIYQAIRTSYPDLLDQFNITQEGVYDNGTWYGAVLRWRGDIHSDKRDSLRIVLHQQSGEWRIAAKPYLTISQTEYPGIPMAVLTAINVINARTSEPSQPSYGTTE